MSKLNKGLVLDTRPLDQPAETYPFAKNGVVDVHNVRQNEPGFRLSGVITPYGTPIGVIETWKHPVLISTNNVNSAFWYYDEVGDVLIPILDDANLTFKLGFDAQHYITGVAQGNYLADVVIAFTDKNGHQGYLNCDHPNVSAPEDLSLFPNAIPPNISIAPTVGGALLPGAYFAAVRYAKNDGTITAFLRQSDPITIGGTPGTVQNQGLLIQLTNVDPNYDIAEIVIISKINGKFDQQLMEDIQLQPVTSVTYTGTTPTTAITLEEILQSPAIYNKIQTMGQLNDSLYIMGLEAPQRVNMQQYANLVKFKWASVLTNTFPADPRVLTGQLRGFMHREAYAFYVQYSLIEGGWSAAYHAPGLALTGADTTASTQAAVGGMVVPRYMVEDTIPDFDYSSRTGSMGKWQNTTETYPNDPSFDSSAIGGEDLRGKPVRHHRFPSLRWCKQNLYQYEPGYGRDKMDVMTLQVSNIIIPAQYANRITGYRILYAKRNTGNSTVIAQSLYLLGGRSQHGYVYNPAVQAEGGPFTNFLSAGGNWFTEDHTTGGQSGIRPLYPDPRILRFHAFDLLFNQPSVSPTYICNELKLKITNINNPVSYIEDGFVHSPNDGPIDLLLDYLTRGLTPVASDDSKVIRKVNSSTYVPNNLVNGDWNNVQAETCFGMTVAGPECLHLGTTSNPADDPTSEFSYMKLILHINQQPGGNIPQYENTFLTNLMFQRDNIYLSFTSQDLVIASSGVSGNQPSSILAGGDVYINDYTFHTYGWIDAVNNGYTGYNDPINGMRIARRFSCEAAANINLRFILPGNLYSDYYPKSPLVAQDLTNYLTLFNRTSDPNQFGYSKDFNTLNDLIASPIFTPTAEDVYKFPYRIHRGGFEDPLNKRRNWKTWAPLDFYEMEKDYGLPVFLSGMDDRLLIHLEKALFVTQDKTKLESDVIAVTLGAGDIFQFPPQPAMYSKLGYGGAQSDLACIITPMGYIFVDTKQGTVFQWKGGLKLLNEGINTFLRLALRVIGGNPFTGNGTTVGFDPFYKRLFITIKNQLLPPTATTPLDWVATPAFVATLTPGQSIIRKDGRLELFLGVNSNPNYGCPVDPIPLVQNYVITIPDNTPVGQEILQVSGVNVNDFFITGGNVASAFALEAATGKLTVAGPLNFHTLPQYVLQCRATNTANLSVNFTITVNLTATTRPPNTGDQVVHIPEHSAAATVVTTVAASDPNSLPLTYTIVAGNDDNAFAIDGTGKITVLTPSAVDYLTHPQFILQVAVSNGIYTVDANITIIVDFVNAPPSANDVVVTIYDTTPNGTRIVDLAQAVVDEGVLAGLQTLAFDIVNDPVPGLFGITTAGAVTVTDNTGFNPSTTPQYIIQLRATDNGAPPLSSLFRLIINILYDPSTIAFAPAAGSCSGSACPSGWNLSPDGTQCIKTTTINATPPSGSLIQVASSTNGAYSDFGGLIYQPGYTSNGVGTIGTQLNASPWNNPTDNNFSGALNRCGVWGATAVPDNTPIGFSVPVFLPSAKTYYIGVAGDNACQISVDGTVIVNQDPTAMGASIATQLPVYGSQGIAAAFKFWHIYPIALPAGNHFIGLQGINFSLAAGFGAEIYDNTIAELSNAQLDPAFVANPASFPSNGNHYSNLNLIFSTRWVRGGLFTSGVGVGYSCPATYGLDATQTPPQCVLMQTQPAVSTSKIWAQVTVTSTKLNATIATLNNVMGQTFQGMAVPYYAPVPNHIDCGGTVQTFLNVQKQQAGIKNDCANQRVGSTVIYYVPAGRYMSTVSLIDANNTATNDATTNAQVYANANGTCT